MFKKRLLEPSTERNPRIMTNSEAWITSSLHFKTKPELFDQFKLNRQSKDYGEVD